MRWAFSRSADGSVTIQGGAVSATSAAGVFAADTEYFVVSKFETDGDIAYVKLFDTSNPGNYLNEPTTWDLSADGLTGVTIDRLDIDATAGQVVLDDISLGTSYVEVIGAMAAEVPVALTPVHDASSAYSFTNFSWTEHRQQFLEVDAPVNYDIQIATDAAFVSLVDEDTVGLARYVHDQPFADGEYYWRVRSVTGEGRISAWSETATFKVAPHQETVTVNYDPAIGDHGTDVLAAVAQTAALAAAGKSVELVFPAGDYYFNDTSVSTLIELPGVTNVAIEGAGANLHFASRKQSLISSEGSHNVSVSGLEVSYATGALRIQGTVTAVDGASSSVTLAIDPEYSDFNASDSHVNDIFLLLDPTIDGRQKTGSVSFYRMVQNGYSQNPDGTWSVTLTSDSGWEVGDRFVYHFRTGSPVLTRFSDSQGVTLHDLELGGWGNIMIASTHGSLFNILNVDTTIQDGKWMVGNADGIHLRGHEVGPWIEGTRIQALGDDGIALYARPASMNSAKPAGVQNAALFRELHFNLERGDEVAFFEPLIGTILLETRVTSVEEQPGNTYLVHFADDLPEGMIFTGNLVDRTQVWNRSKSTGDFMIRHGEMLNIRRYGTVFRSQRGIVENMEYSGASSRSIIFVNGTQWPNGLYASEIIVRNNLIQNSGIVSGNAAPLVFTFNGHGTSAQSIGPRNLLIENNTFVDNGSPEITMNDTHNAVIRNNRTHTGSGQFTPATHSASDSERIVFTNDDWSGDTTPPAAPAGLVAMSGSGVVSLDWLRGTEVDLALYNVYRATAMGGPWSLLAANVFESRYDDEGVAGGATYYYYVTADDVTGNESAASGVVSATPDPAAALALAAESFDYTIGTELDNVTTSGTANGGTGWAGGWTTTQTALRLDAADTSLWFGNAPEFNQDGTGHIEGANSSSSIRDWSTPIDLGTTDLYFVALVQIPTADTQARFEFYDSPGATGNMRLNVGFHDYDTDGNVDLFIDANSPSYPVGAAYASGGINVDSSYLLIAKRDQHTVSASLLSGDGTPSHLVEPTTWDVTQVGNSGVDLQSMKIASSTGAVRIDELRIGTTFVEAVAGLPVMIETEMLLTSPAHGSTEYQTIPYFEWTDVVAHPYLGNYEIQIDDDADFSSLFDQDSIPAMLSWYSPTVEFTRGTTYHWRVRHVDENGVPDSWSSAQTFTIGFPFVVDVLPTDGWDEIQAKYVQVADYGGSNAQAAELRFPENQVFNLVQDPADDYLLEYPDKGNFIINGRGSTLILQCTQAGEAPQLCGFLRLSDQSDVQLRDIIVDYAADSLAQYGGVISNLDTVNGTFTVTVDTNVYANFHEASTISQGTFAYAETGARIQDLTRFQTVETWADAQQNPGVFNFTFDTTPNPALLDELENGDTFISSPIPDRGGDVIRLDSSGSANNFVANDVTTWASRGRFVAGGVYHTRVLNSDFLRTQGRLRGSASGGVNHQVDYAWYENDRFEYTRDDSFHDGGTGAESDSPGQMVIRNSQVIGAYRNSIWVQMDRHWVADNVVQHAGSHGIFIGRSGVTNTTNDQMDVGLIENNVVLGVRGVGVRSGANLSALPDPVTGFHNQYLTIRNNTVFDAHTDQAFELDYLSNSVVENNRVSSTTSDWSAYSDPSLQIGFHFDDSVNTTGSGNRVYDARLDPADHLVIEPTSTNITVQVINAVAVSEAPLFIFDPFEQRGATAGVVYASSLEYDAIDYNGDPLTFTKVSGPAWLNIAADGTLSGTPDSVDSGLNSWTVEVSDGLGGLDAATLFIFVEDALSLPL